MLAPALRGNIGNRALDYLEQSLLHALSGNIPGDGRVFIFLGDLVDFVNVNDSLLGPLDVSLGVL